MPAKGIIAFSTLIIVYYVVSNIQPVYSLPQRGAADYSVTHLDIRDAILSLVSVLRDQMDKLERHEIRERQLGEQLTRSLAILEKRGRGDEKNIESIATYIARMEEKMKFMQATVEKQAEDRRLENIKTNDEIQHIKRLLESGQSTEKLSANLDVKVLGLEQKLDEIQVGNDQNTEKFNSLMELWKETTLNSPQRNSDGSGELSESLMDVLYEIKEGIIRTQDTIQSSKDEGGSDWQREILESLNSQRKQLAILEEDIGRSVTILGDMTKSASSLQTIISSLGEDTKKGFELLDEQVEILRYSPEEEGNVSPDGMVGDEKLSQVQHLLKTGQKGIEKRVRQAESLVQTMFVKMESNYEKLGDELKGLANVESVLLDTGDSVMDVKRRLEYGVQQIMGEFKHQLATQTANLNASIQTRFDGLANSLLTNQSIALTNLTSRMEEDLSQVWRQIGILYHQMSRSSTLLDNIHNMTAGYVNNSLKQQDSMDGKVGQITNQQQQLDDNLNYLLGRMSLVAQEFNMIKGGLGTALGNMKENFKEIIEMERKPNLDSQSGSAEDEE